MKDIVRYRAMESLCRKSAVFHPIESWRLLAEAEMWHHKAQEEIDSRSRNGDTAPPAGTLAESTGKSADANRSLRV
jgi:hypothetical protein